MSHFYANIRGHRGEATRMGHKSSGMYSNTAGWKGAISVHVWYDNEKDEDRYRVQLNTWQGSGGRNRVIASGPLDATASDPIDGGTLWDENQRLREALEKIDNVAEEEIRKEQDTPNFTLRKIVDIAFVGYQQEGV